MRSTASPLPVIMIMGTLRAARSSRATFSPSSPPSFRSRVTRLTGAASSSAMAWRPSAASITEKPSASKPVRSRVRTSGSSSTIRIRLDGAADIWPSCGTSEWSCLLHPVTQPHNRVIRGKCHPAIIRTKWSRSLLAIPLVEQSTVALVADNYDECRWMLRPLS